MSPALLSIKRPFFITCLVILMLVLGYRSLVKMPVDLFPDVTFPTVVIETQYPGSGPSEIETEISKIIEDELSSISGIKKISSTSREGFSIITAEFNLSVDLKYAEQQVRAKVDNVRRDLPVDIEQPVIRTVSPSDSPILQLSLNADLPPGDLFDLADDVIRPLFEQVPQVGQVDVLGGRKREIHVLVDRNKAKYFEIPVQAVSAALNQAGRNIPSGKVENGTSEQTFRTIATYQSIEEIKDMVVRQSHGGQTVTVGDLAEVYDALEDETSRTWVNAKQAVQFQVYRQSGANTVAVAEAVKKRVIEINHRFAETKGKPVMTVVNDRSRIIDNNVHDVYESIIIGIILTVLVVYFFLGSLRSTFITGLALPNSLIGAFIFMAWWGFSINIMSLLALSLVVGLLVDDAIVVRENIYRKIEEGLDATKAALIGANEVTLPVIATTLTILAVFGPIGNLDGIVGQFFKQFGITICIAMLVSLFDALTVAPMLSAYFAGNLHKVPARTWFGKINEGILKGFDRFQSWLEDVYEWCLRICLRFSISTMVGGLAVFIFSLYLVTRLPIGFTPASDDGEFNVNYDLPLGASLYGTFEVGAKIDKIIRQQPQIKYSVFTVGSRSAEAQKGQIYVRLVDTKERKENTTEVKDLLREKLKEYQRYNLKIADPDISGQAQRQFNMNITGSDLEAVQKFSAALLEKIRNHPALKEVDTSYREGKPELQVVVDPSRAQETGVSTRTLGVELRSQIEGDKTAIYRREGRDYDVRVRVRPDQRDLATNFSQISIPNVNNQLVPLRMIAKAVPSRSPAEILRENRAKYVQISADINPTGPGLGRAMADIREIAKSMNPPPGIEVTFVGQAERFAELVTNIVVSLALGVFFIYLILVSLYESFITPFTIMLVIPLAACGAFIALFVAQRGLDLYSMIGCVTLMGLATKNSILIVDYTQHQLKAGKDRAAALIEAGRVRLRPILMTTFAMIAGMVPVAIGLNEASRPRKGLGIAIIGGTISSTVLTLVVIPAAFLFIDRFETWFRRIFNRYIRGVETNERSHNGSDNGPDRGSGSRPDERGSDLSERNPGHPAPLTGLGTGAYQDGYTPQA